MKSNSPVQHGCCGASATTMLAAYTSGCSTASSGLSRKRFKSQRPWASGRSGATSLARTANMCYNKAASPAVPALHLSVIRILLEHQHITEDILREGSAEPQHQQAPATALSLKSHRGTPSMSQLTSHVKNDFLLVDRDDHNFDMIQNAKRSIGGTHRSPLCPDHVKERAYSAAPAIRKLGITHC